MSDAMPPFPPATTQQHPGPPEGWRPMSGLAVTSFVLSLVFGIVALVGAWISELIPLGLAVLTLTTVSSAQRRGRMLAIWAVVIAVCFGSCSFALHAKARGTLGHMAESILIVLSADVSPEKIDADLKPWMHEESVEEDAELLSSIRARFADAVEALGAYQDRIDLGTPFLGSAPLFIPPKGVVEIKAGGKPPEWSLGTAVWVKAQFERGSAHVAIRLAVDDQGSVPDVQGAEEGEPVPLVRDVRFFRDAPGAGTGPK